MALLNKNQHWFRYSLGAKQMQSHYLNQWWPIQWHIYVSPAINESYIIRNLLMKQCPIVESFVMLSPDISRHYSSSMIHNHLLVFHSKRQIYYHQVMSEWLLVQLEVLPAVSLSSYSEVSQLTRKIKILMIAKYQYAKTIQLLVSHNQMKMTISFPLRYKTHQYL